MRTLLALCALALVIGACSDKEAEKACFEGIKRYQNALSSDDFRKTGFSDPVFDELLALAKQYQASSAMQCQALQKFADAIKEGRSKMVPPPAPAAPEEPVPAESAPAEPAPAASAPAPAPPAK
ncbi:MAG: hypothetical protein JXR83_10005 [Deltaproteobacteria bacterium]|nr:hypothetical protein [Deltaproteobacteria bacterium]